MCNLLLAEQITHMRCGFIPCHCLAVVRNSSAGSVPVLLFSLAVPLLVVVTAYHCFYSVRYLVIFLIDH